MSVGNLRLGGSFDRLPYHYERAGSSNLLQIEAQQTTLLRKKTTSRGFGMALQEVDVRRIVSRLADEAGRLEEAQTKLVAARTDFEIAVRNFAAVRDMATAHLNFPYGQFMEEIWPDRKMKGMEFRFALLPTGEAVLAALSEVEGPQTVFELMTRLVEGGANVFAEVSTRGITAALTRYLQTRVDQVEGDKYQLKDPDDVPL